MSTITVSQLVSGQAEIDRMRNEIVAVANSLIGLVKSTDCHRASNFSYGQAALHVRVGALMWYIEVASCNTGQIAIRCNGPVGDIFSTRTSAPVPLQYVKAVHDSLDILLEQMLDEFPVLEERLQPLL